MAAEKLENDFGDCKLVEQIWVYGNSYEVGSGAFQLSQLCQAPGMLWVLWIESSDVRISSASGLPGDCTEHL